MVIALCFSGPEIRLYNGHMPLLRPTLFCSSKITSVRPAKTTLRPLCPLTAGREGGGVGIELIPIGNSRRKSLNQLSCFLGSSEK